ncbi:MAG TPA: hypothetical protein VNF07_01560 [Acidimicrobiales bacterium]|nr:hypothetical protein [Acidimicrobiales bacterium]
MPSLRRLLHKTGTAVGLPGRVVAVEDQSRDLERRVGERLDEVRHELAEIRRMLEAMSQADAESVELTGRLLRSTADRLDLLEEYAGIPQEASERGVPSV